MNRGRSYGCVIARRLRGERGWTLFELLAAMVVSLIIGAAALTAIQTGRSSTEQTTARQEAVQEAQVALARIGKDVRTAPVAAVRGSGFLDLKTYVRVDGGAQQLRRVQYDCSTGALCTRKDCGSIALSGSVLSLAQSCNGPTTQLVGGLDGVTFGVRSQGAALTLPREAMGTTPAFDTVTTAMRVRLDDFGSGRRASRGLAPVEIQGGVRLENVGTP